jgi:hypothetical protein
MGSWKCDQGVLQEALLESRGGREHVEVKDEGVRLHLLRLPSGGVRWVLWFKGETVEGYWPQQIVSRLLRPGAQDHNFEHPLIEP